jgi:hypothetical protein
LLRRKGKRKRYKSHKELVSPLKSSNSDEFRMGMRRQLENHFSRILTENNIHPQ